MLYLIVLIATVLLIYYFYNKSQFNLYNGDKWADYRLGDVYMMNKNDRIYNLDYKDNILYHKTKYPGTIAHEYINRNEESGKNLTLLQEIIRSRTKDRSNYPDTLFLHIRVGDVLCVKDNEWINKVNGPLYYSKVGDTAWWDKVAEYIRQNSIKRVVILSGSHMNKCLVESANYIENRKKFLLKCVSKVDLRLGQSPDEDVIMCYYVKHFITTGGGYGNMIKEIKIK
jgi:hypothetical protein